MVLSAHCLSVISNNKHWQTPPTLTEGLRSAGRGAQAAGGQALALAMEHLCPYAAPIWLWQATSV